MRILVVCGAGASSTFLAHRIRRAGTVLKAKIDVRACAESMLEANLNGVDAVLVGPHLPRLANRLRAERAGTNLAVVLLPEDIFANSDGLRALTLAMSAATST